MSMKFGAATFKGGHSWHTPKHVLYCCYIRYDAIKKERKKMVGILSLFCERDACISTSRWIKTLSPGKPFLGFLWWWPEWRSVRPEPHWSRSRSGYSQVGIGVRVTKKLLALQLAPNICISGSIFWNVLKKAVNWRQMLCSHRYLLLL